ncbi:MAG: GNAT family N-acetyltransferase [Mariprofundus sp.]
MTADIIRPIPWDSRAFGIDCFEIDHACEHALTRAMEIPGHYTVRVSPLGDKSLLYRYGFYYVDTLIEPVCNKNKLIAYRHPDCHIDADTPLDVLLPMCMNSFQHGRFHRDHNIPNEAADRRYAQWLTQLRKEGSVFGLYFQCQLAGFVACHQEKLLLHAMHEQFRGKGLAKYFWTEVSERLFHAGAESVSSSISAANLPSLNLYSRLGFRFTKVVDVYHKMNH